MAYKKYREMKVYEASGYQYKRTPSIVLKGQWLSELGFDIGEQIEVKCEDGRLVISFPARVDIEGDGVTCAPNVCMMLRR